MIVDIVNTKTVSTVKIKINQQTIYFHSKYDPLHEASIWRDNAIDDLKENMDIIVIGLGAGYHIKALAEALPKRTIVVIEFNDFYYEWFKNSPFYLAFSKFTNVNVTKFSALSISKKENLFSSISSTNILIHKNGLDIIPKEYQNIELLLKNISLQKGSLRHQIGFMSSNFSKNILLNDSGIREVENMYIGKPMILVSAGPSLTKQLPLLKRIHEEKEFIIGAVGTALKPLVNYQILPDLFMIIDAQASSSQLETVSPINNIPLFYLSTAFHDTVRLHHGPRKIVWQAGYAEAEKMAILKNEQTIQTGGSVATALLDLMVFLGGKSIGLVGQDLAFTDGKSHAYGTPAQTTIEENREDKTTQDYNRTGYVYTANNLNLYRKWFEDYAKAHIDLCLYNCTEGGAYIKNWNHISLHEFYLKFKK